MKQTISTTPLLKLSQVNYLIGKIPLVSKIDLAIFPNDRMSVIGPNGAGKSTLVKLMLDLLTPSSGRVDKQSGIIIGYVPQKFSVPSILPLRVQDLLSQTRANRLNADEKQQLFTELSIQPLLNKQLVHLSGGENQRVLLARALLEKPELLILDEPMQGLDPETEELLYKFIDELPDFLRCAMIVISHDLHWVMKGSRHVICLNKHICCQGQPEDVRNMGEFQQMFGYASRTLFSEHKYEQPYIHHHDRCNHAIDSDEEGGCQC